MMLLYDMIFKYDGFILHTMIMSNMDTQYNIWYLPSESNPINKWKSLRSINYHVNNSAVSPNSGVLLHQIPYFSILFRYLKPLL